jgi:hypothetical protein
MESGDNNSQCDAVTILKSRYYTTIYVSESLL